MNGPLRGFRIVDLTHAIAGPWCTMILGDMGAEVIKIEPPVPYQARRFGGPKYKGEPFFHLAFNRSKKSLTLNLRTKGGREALLNLVKISDVVVDNFRPKVLKGLGLDYDSLVKVNSKIITCGITGYGPSGPYCDRPSFDLIVAALSGTCDLTGEPDGKPVRPGPAIGDILAGTLASGGICAALLEREKTGKGQRIDIGMLDASVAMLAYQIAWYFCGGGVPKRMGAGHLALVPYNIYKTQTKYIAIAIGWPRVCRALNLEWMIDDPRFQSHDLRIQHREIIDKAIQDRLMEASAEDWLALLEVEDIAAAPVNDISEVVEDPQVKYRNMVIEVEHPLGGWIKLAGNPVKMPDSIDDSSYEPPPTLGQHNYEILCNVMGYSREEADKVLDEGKAAIAELEEHLYRTI